MISWLQDFFLGASQTPIFEISFFHPLTCIWRKPTFMMQWYQIYRLSFAKNQRNSMKIFEIQWNFMKSDDIFMKFVEICQKIDEIPWKSMKFYEILLKFIKQLMKFNEKIQKCEGCSKNWIQENSLDSWYETF